jgi:hypothetical protein
VDRPRHQASRLTSLNPTRGVRRSRASPPDAVLAAWLESGDPDGLGPPQEFEPQIVTVTGICGQTCIHGLVDEVARPCRLLRDGADGSFEDVAALAVDPSMLPMYATRGPAPACGVQCSGSQSRSGS